MPIFARFIPRGGTIPTAAVGDCDHHRGELVHRGGDVELF